MQQKNLEGRHSKVSALDTHWRSQTDSDRPYVQDSGITRSVPAPSPVLVLGTSRSDTSVTARVLEALGIDFGTPETRMFPLPEESSSGYLEPIPAYSLNDRILAALGNSRLQPPAAGTDVTKVEGIDEFRAEAGNLISRLFSHDRRWGLRAPCLGVLMDIWRPLLDFPHYIICSSDPRDFHTHPSRQSLESWGRHTAAALSASTTAPRLVVDNNALIENPPLQIERIARFLNVDNPASLQAAVETVWEAERPRPASGPITLDPDVPHTVTELYSAMCHLAGISVSPPNNAPVLWLTGLPAAGKSTIAELTAQRLIAKGIPVEVLDGDEVRKAISPTLGFSRDERALQARRLAWIAEMLSRHGVVPIVAAVSPYRSDREAAANLLGSRYTEVWVHAEAAVCRKRDPKGLWRRCELGEISGVTGFDAPYEAPLSANMKLETEINSAHLCANELVHFVEEVHGNLFVNNR